MATARKTYIKRTIDTLYGIIEGISFDNELNEDEITGLYDWMSMHMSLSEVEPFKSLWLMLNDIIQDQVIDDSEREELLEWCNEILDERGFLSLPTDMLRALHGICTGIIADKKITKDELINLQDWLLDYEEFQSLWPVNEIMLMIKDVLKDGIIDQEEHKKLFEYFEEFSEIPLDNVRIHDKEYFENPGLRSVGLPFFTPISMICEENPVITFKSKKFCFTGPAVAGKRVDSFNMVEHLGGIAVKTVVTTLDYLIIGGQSSPAWVYSTYGRKIEQALQKNKDKPQKHIHIISEKSFISAVIKQKGDSFLQKYNLSRQV